MNYRLAKDRLECRVTLLVVWHRVSRLVASFVAAVDMYGWRNSGQTSGPVEAEQNVHNMCLTLCWFVDSETSRVLYPQWCLAIKCGS